MCGVIIRSSFLIGINEKKPVKALGAVVVQVGLFSRAFPISLNISFCLFVFPCLILD